MTYFLYYLLGLLSCFTVIVCTTTHKLKEEHVLHAFFWSVMWGLLFSIIVVGVLLEFFRRILPDWLSTFPCKLFLMIDDNITKFSKFILGE